MPPGNKRVLTDILANIGTLSLVLVAVTSHGTAGYGLF